MLSIHEYEVGVDGGMKQKGYAFTVVLVNVLDI